MILGNVSHQRSMPKVSRTRRLMMRSKASKMKKMQVLKDNLVAMGWPSKTKRSKVSCFLNITPVGMNKSFYTSRLFGVTNLFYVWL